MPASAAVPLPAARQKPMLIHHPAVWAHWVPVPTPANLAEQLKRPLLGHGERVPQRQGAGGGGQLKLGLVHGGLRRHGDGASVLAGVAQSVSLPPNYLMSHLCAVAT
jgi:hypothetical protein